MVGPNETVVAIPHRCRECGQHAGSSRAAFPAARGATADPNQACPLKVVGARGAANRFETGAGTLRQRTGRIMTGQAAGELL
jgi:hypothetical protein